MTIPEGPLDGGGDLDGGSTSDQWVPFSTRYGIASDDRFADHEGHNRHTLDAPAAPDRQRCDCLGTSRLRCAAYADQEDMICAECRAWCWGVTHDGTSVPLPRLVAS